MDMKMAKNEILKHILTLVATMAVISLFIVYPYLPGEYDRLAMPLSIVVQSFGLTGLILTLVGLLWLIMPQRNLVFAKIALYLSTLIVLFLAFLSFLTAGKAIGVIIVATWLFAFFRLKKIPGKPKNTMQNKFSFVPIYLIILPVFVLTIQLILSEPLTRWSRNRAIKNAYEFIAHIENFHVKYGYYPRSVKAMYPDYSPQITGIDQYHYFSSGDTYNLSFEQPLFLFDKFGAREWVVYNPKDDHKVYSHTSWFLLLSPEELERCQGWYSSGKLEQLHWKYFLYD